MLTANIDMDYVIHCVCAAAEYGKDPDDIDMESVFYSIEKKCLDIMREANCESKRLFITKGNFRHFLIGDYKGNRKDTWRPSILGEARDYCELFMGCESLLGLEADDLLKLEQTKDTVLCTVDKDLDQVDGLHLGIKTQHRDWELYTVEEGWRKFYHQLLIGDSTDNILGCATRIQAVWKSGAKAGQTYMKRKGVGEKYAKHLLKDLNEDDCKLACKEEYQKLFGDMWQGKMEQQARLVYMVDEIEDGYARLWTYDNRPVWMNPSTGEYRLEG